MMDKSELFGTTQREMKDIVIVMTNFYPDDPPIVVDVLSRSLSATFYNWLSLSRLTLKIVLFLAKTFKKPLWIKKYFDEFWVELESVILPLIIDFPPKDIKKGTWKYFKKLDF